MLISQSVLKMQSMKVSIKGELPWSLDQTKNLKTAYLPPDERPAFIKFLENLGKQAFEIYNNTRLILNFFGEVIVTFLRCVWRGRPVRRISLTHLIDVVGFQAIPIITLISILIGAVLAYQGVNQLAKFGASVYAVDFLAISLLRELSVLLTSIVIAGRSGSSFTAQIGTMALNEEIDAIRVLGLDPIEVLVIPRVMALVISLPLLVLLSILMGSIGGMIVTKLTIDMPFGEFWNLFQNSVQKTTFWTGMSKAPLFAIIISVIGCFRGMQVKGSAESVGLMTTQSVVESIFMVIICDGFLSIFFSSMDW